VYVLIWKGLAEGIDGCVDCGEFRGIWRGLADVRWGSGARIRDRNTKKKRPGGARRLDANIYDGKYSPFGRTCQDNNLLGRGFFGRGAGEGEERLIAQKACDPKPYLAPTKRAGRRRRASRSPFGMT